MKKTIITTILVLAALVAQAAKSDSTFLGMGFRFEGRVGYNIGGTAPMGMPATIRALNRFSLTPNITFGLGAYKPIYGRWGAKVGITFENKGMDMDARVKNYHMEIVKGGEVLAGMFTGNVVTRVTQWMFTVPLQVTCDVGKVRLRCGPYFSYLTGRTFDGWAYDGHLRVDDPTGAKVMLGHDEGERGEYDFSDSMRRLQIGMGIGADWYFMRKFGVWADLNMGFHGVHKSDFRTIEQTLYPIYGAVGITYKIR